MVRHLVHAVNRILVLVVCLSALAGRAEAQTAGIGGILDDPFTFYYAYYLPNQHARDPKFPSVISEIHFCPYDLQKRVILHQNIPRLL